MKLYMTTRSPYVRKVLVSAHELGIAGGIELLERPVHVIDRVAEVVALNPLGQVPTLVADDGTAIYDSRVICEYLHMLVPGSTLFPAAAAPRMRALTEQALADGMLAAALLGLQERSLRPADKFHDGWYDAQMAKIAASLDRFEDMAAGFEGRIDIGTIAVGCALSYLDFRYPQMDWRAARPGIAAWYATVSQRPSFAVTGLYVSAAKPG